MNTRRGEDSHPSSGVGAAGWSMLTNGWRQVELQIPSMHERMSTLSNEHALKHAPQLSGSVMRSGEQGPVLDDPPTPLDDETTSVVTVVLTVLLDVETSDVDATEELDDAVDPAPP
jgi:hypothetical protein